MVNLEAFTIWFSEEWKGHYKEILYEEHLDALAKNIEKFNHQKKVLQLPYFKDEIKTNLPDSFNLFIDIIDSKTLNNEEKASNLEKIPFKDWLIVLGQRLTSASLHDERAIPPRKKILIESCKKPFNNEITVSQRAWEKHIGRTTGIFWGEIAGNNNHKKEKVMNKIIEIIENKTWWNIFYHYKHGLVYEIREKDGHGIRWNNNGTQLIGFLDGFIND